MRGKEVVQLILKDLSAWQLPVKEYKEKWGTYIKISMSKAARPIHSIS